MTKFLFWNLNRKPLSDLIAKLAIEESIDILILAECTIGSSELLIALNSTQSQKYSFAFSPSKRLLILSRLPHNSIRPIFDNEYLSIRRVIPPVGVEILLVAVHLSSKLFQDSDDQALTAPRFARTIEREENVLGHRRTVVVGDFNMNPFEVGIAGGEALHAVMDKQTALKGSRIIAGQERFFFYNPMWSRMGDESLGPPGTYYRQSSKQVNYFWNTFDQILLRPQLISRFDHQGFKVLKMISETSLLTKEGIPDVAVASDHLPLLFGLNLLEM